MTFARVSESIEVERITTCSPELPAVVIEPFTPVTDLAFDISRNRLLHIEFHLCTADKIDGEVKQVETERQPQQRHKAGCAEQDGDNAEDFEIFNNREFAVQ